MNIFADSKVFNITSESAGSRLDIFVSQNYPDISRVKIQRCIKDGVILINNERSRKRDVLKEGDVVEVDQESIRIEYEVSLKPQELDLDILFEDEYFVAINKPAGLVVHPGIGNYEGTLVNGLLFRYKSLSSGSSFDRPGIVHRLDKNTSGVIVVAKTDDAHNALGTLFAERSVVKKYSSLCIGKHPEDKAIINAPIGRRKNDPMRFCVSDTGKEAITEYSLVASHSGISLLSIRLHTGRTHQIRVHCSHSGFPIIKDNLYGGEKSKVLGLQPLERPFAYKIYKCFTRQALHAREISFLHPFTKKNLAVKAPFPDDFQKAIDSFWEVQMEKLEDL